VTDVSGSRLVLFLVLPDRLLHLGWLVCGDNTVTIKHKEDSTATVVVRDVHIKVDY